VTYTPQLVSEVGGSDRIGFFRSGYAREYVTQIRDYELKNVTHITTRKMSMQQIIEMLEKMAADRKADKEVNREANQELLTKMKEDRKADEDLPTKMKEDRKADKEDLLASMDAFHEKRMAMLEAQQKRMMAWFGQTEANTEKIEPGMMQSVEEHQDVPNEDVTVMPVGE
jgi:hypothetical protein